MRRRITWTVGFLALLIVGAAGVSYHADWKQIAADRARLDWLHLAKGEGYVVRPYTTCASRGGLDQIPFVGDLFATEHVELTVYVQNDAGARALLPRLATCPAIISQIMYHCDDVSPNVLSELHKQSSARTLSPLNPPPNSNSLFGRHVPGKDIAGRPLAVGG